VTAQTKAELMRATRANRRAEGKCIRCGKRKTKTRLKFAKCQKCSDSASAEIKASRAKKGQQ
jgi:hypothetical protein